MDNTPRERSKADWTTASLGDVVDVINDYWDRDTAVPERLVAGEHIDEGDMQVRRWAMTSDDLIPPTFNRWFRSGDALLHSRNIKKVAQPAFPGITGEKLFILRSKDEAVLLQNLVPFLVSSEDFRSYAETRWAGSTNKFLNKTPLLEYEFSLPPIEEQQRIASVLAAGLASCEAQQRLVTATEEVQAAHRDAALVGPTNLHKPRLDDVELTNGWQLVPATDIAIAPVSSGVTPRGGQANPDPKCRFIKVGDLSFDGRLLYNDAGSRLSRQAFDATTTLHVEDGDVLTNIVGPPLGKVSVVPSGFGAALINQAIVRFRMPNEDMRDWIAEFLMSRWAKQWLFARSKKTSGQRNINARTCGELPIPIPPERELASQLQLLRSMRESVERVRGRLRSARELFRTLAAEALQK